MRAPPNHYCRFVNGSIVFSILNDIAPIAVLSHAYCHMHFPRVFLSLYLSTVGWLFFFIIACILVQFCNESSASQL